MAKARVVAAGTRFFIGFGFRPDSELHRFYHEINDELFARYGVPRLSQTHAPHLTVCPPPMPGDPLGDVEEAASRLVSVGRTLPALAPLIDGWGWFGSNSANLHLRVVESSDFQKVFNRLVKAMRGLLSPNKPYLPHVSFARWLSPGDRLRAAQYIESRPPIPFTHLALDELTLFVKHNRGYRPHTSVSLPTT